MQEQRVQSAALYTAFEVLKRLAVALAVAMPLAVVTALLVATVALVTIMIAAHPVGQGKAPRRALTLHPKTAPVC